jgi:hypothetical protein
LLKVHEHEERLFRWKVNRIAEALGAVLLKHEARVTPIAKGVRFVVVVARQREQPEHDEVA